ncbi:hypothetical protein D3C80_1381100 [compost metagenome]
MHGYRSSPNHQIILDVLDLLLMSVCYARQLQAQADHGDNRNLKLYFRYNVRYPVLVKPVLSQTTLRPTIFYYISSLFYQSFYHFPVYFYYCSMLMPCRNYRFCRNIFEMLKISCPYSGVSFFAIGIIINQPVFPYFHY